MVVISKPVVRTFNGVNFYASDGTTANKLFWGEEMERSYARGHEITVGHTEPKRNKRAAKKNKGKNL